MGATERDGDKETPERREDAGTMGPAEERTRTTPPAVWVQAPAKVNLLLRVLHRRPDGFRELETLFQAISLSDEVGVSFEREERTGSSRGMRAVALRVRSDDEAPPPDLGPPERNLAVRAARGFLALAGMDGRVGVELRKRIPAGAGLGGGSSDAAAVLKGLVSLTGFSDARAILRLAGSLGSDVPFFLQPSPLALGRGRGERLQPLPPLPRASLVLALPPVHVSTGDAYGALGELRWKDGVEVDPHGGPRELDLEGLTWARVRDLAENDFESVVLAKEPSVAASLEGLAREGAGLVLMSGSGAACFGRFDEPGQAAAAARTLEDRLGWPFLAVTTGTTTPTPRRGDRVD